MEWFDWLIIILVSLATFAAGWHIRGKELKAQREIKRLNEENARLRKANLELRELEDQRFREGAGAQAEAAQGG